MKRSFIAVMGLFLLLYILPLGVRPMVIPDECRYAEIPREMIASGDWVVPHLNGLRYFEKPVLGYWINALSIKLFGENAFAVRLPSALAAGITAILIFVLALTFTGGRWDGMLASLILLTCLEPFAIGVFTILDGIFSMFITAAMVSFFFAHMDRKGGKRAGLLALFGAFCGLAFLTKGFIAFAIPVVAIVPFMIWEHQWKKLFTLSWMPIIVAILVALPWGLMIHIREGDFWNYFFWTEHIKRFMSSNPQHPQPFWFFIPVIILGALPWSVLFPAVISGIKRTHLKNPLTRFVICWFMFPFIFFSASHGKLATYILPCFPPLAVLIAIGLLSYLENVKKRAFTLGMYLMAFFTVMIGATLIIGQMTGFPGIRAYGPAETWKWVLLTAGLLAWAAFFLIAMGSSNPGKKIVLVAIAPVCFMFIAHFAMPDQTRKRKAPGGFLLSNNSRIEQETILVSDDDTVHAVCWFYKRNNVYLFMDLGELSYGLGYDDSKDRLLNIDQFRRLINKNNGNRQIVLICKSKYYMRYRDLIPEPVFEDSDGRFALALF
ncbi:MAG: phospholipid carrier-dependent glycosyltransferase [bacterium]